MKKIIIKLLFLPILVPFLFTNCQADRISYDGPSYILFSDTLNLLPVQVDNPYVDIPVVATQICDYDRTVGVEVVEKTSNAVEGKHYELEANQVTIKAGENVTNIRVRGFYDAITVSDSLGFVLRLVEDNSFVWEYYGNETKVVLQKVCPFNIYDFTGYATIQSSYMSNYMNVSQRLIQTEVDPENENTIILRNCFYDGNDLSIHLTTNDMLNPLIEMDDQLFATTADAFGTIYGDGIIRTYQAANYVSYYSSCEQFIFQYMTLYVPNYPSKGISTAVGTFYNLIHWISDDEAEKLKLEGY